MDIMNKQKPILLSAFILLTLITVGCSPQYVPPDYSGYFFPPPPEKKRLQLLSIVRGDVDVRKQSVQEGLFGRSAFFIFKKPLDIVVDDDGTAYISDTYKGTIFKMNLDKNTADYFGRIGSWKDPKGLGIDTKNKLLGVIDGKKVLIVSLASGRQAIDLKGVPFVKPAGIAFDPNNKLIYVTDIRTNEIYQFDYKGKHLRTFGGRGPEEKHLYFPGQTALDSEGFLYVVDTMHWKIKVFNKEGGFERSFGDHGNAPGMFGRPKGISINRDDVVMVTDSDFNRFTLFTKMGAALLIYGNPGSGPGQFINPYGIAVDNKDRIYIVDQSNRRLQVYQLYTDKFYDREFEKEVTANPDTNPDLVKPGDENAPKATVGGQDKNAPKPAVEGQDKNAPKPAVEEQ